MASRARTPSTMHVGVGECGLRYRSAGRAWVEESGHTNPVGRRLRPLGSPWIRRASRHENSAITPLFDQSGHWPRRGLSESHQRTRPKSHQRSRESHHSDSAFGIGVHGPRPIGLCGVEPCRWRNARCVRDRTFVSTPGFEPKAPLGARGDADSRRVLRSRCFGEKAHEIARARGMGFGDIKFSLS